MQFTGAERQAALGRLLEDWASVRAGGGPRMVWLNAPLGWGKTRIVQEFYAQLASSQTFWPPTMVAQDVAATLDAVHRERKTLTPPPFEVPAGMMPPFLWLGVRADESANARPEDAYRTLIEQLTPLLWPILRRRKLAEASRRVVSRILTSFVLPIPADIETLLDAKDIVTDFTDEVGGLFARRRTVGSPAVGTHADEVWQLFTTVWGLDGRGGPPMVVVVEDVHYVAEATVDLLRAALASQLPFLIIGCGWPVTDYEPRHRPFAEFATSRPPRLREERLAPLSTDELAGLVEARHPGTPTAKVGALVERSGGSPYVLRLMCLRLRAATGEPVAASTGLIARMHSDVHGQLEGLLANEPRETQLGLAAMSLVGQRMPVNVGLRAALAAPGAEFAAALRSHWIRRDEMSDELVAFIERVRYEVAQAWATSVMEDGERLAVLVAALEVVRTLLDDDVPDPDRPLLGELHLRLGEVGVETDAAALSRSVMGLWRSLRPQRAKLAMENLIVRADALAVLSQLDGESAADYAVARLRAVNFVHDRSHPVRQEAIHRALAATDGWEDRRPDLRVTALASYSGLHGIADIREHFDLTRSRAIFEQAKALMLRHPGMDPDAVYVVRTREYSLLSAGGDREKAMHLALQVCEDFRGADGSHTSKSLGALVDAAFYATRHHPPLGVELTRMVRAARAEYWRSPQHPRVALADKDLAIRLLRLDNDTMVEEALRLADSTYPVLLDAYGDEATETLNALSIRGLARRRMARLRRLERRTADAEALIRGALSDAQQVLSVRERVVPGKRHLLSRERLAAATAEAGDPHGLTMLRACLQERLETLGEPISKAEVRWTAEDLRYALLLHRRGAEADAVTRRYQLDGPARVPPDREQS